MPPPPPCTPVPHFPALAHRGGATCAGSKAFPALPPEEGRGGDAVQRGWLKAKTGSSPGVLSGEKGQTLGFPPELRAGDGFRVLGSPRCAETFGGGHGDNGQRCPHILLVGGGGGGVLPEFAGELLPSGRSLKRPGGSQRPRGEAASRPRVARSAPIPLNTGAVGLPAGLASPTWLPTHATTPPHTRPHPRRPPQATAANFVARMKLLSVKAPRSISGN